jgi:VWFA-related protein
MPAPKRLAILTRSEPGPPARCAVEVIGDPTSVERIELRIASTEIGAVDGFSLKREVDRPCERIPELRAFAYREGRVLDRDEWRPCAPQTGTSATLILPLRKPLAGATPVRLAVVPEPGRSVVRVRFFWRDAPAGEATEAPYATTIDLGSGATGVLRASAELDDGTSVEDARLVNAPGFTESLSVTERSVVVAATAGGDAMTGLEPGDLETVERGVPLPATRVTAASDLPLSLALVIDASDSRSFEFTKELDEALQRLQGELEGEDVELQVVVFKDRAGLLLGPTRRFADVAPALARVRAGGATGLYDALVFAALQLRAAPGRRALLVLTDGEDTASHADLPFAVNSLRRLGTPAFLIASREPRDAGGQFRLRGYRERIDRVLNDLGEGTGGGTMVTGRPDEKSWAGSFQSIRRRLAEQVRVSYDSLGGWPESVRYTGNRRGVRLVLLRPERRCAEESAPGD